MATADVSSDDDDLHGDPSNNNEICRFSSSHINSSEQSSLQCRQNNFQLAQNSGSPIVNQANKVVHGDVYKECDFHIHKNYFLQQGSSALPIEFPNVQSESSEIPVSSTNEELQKKLKRFYKKAILPCVHWLNEGADLVLKDFYVELEQIDSTDTNSTKPIKLQKLFQNVDDEKPTRILLEGQPGNGKTTVATKLAYDWSMDEKYLRQFNAVFLIPLRQLSGNSLEEAMNDLCKTCDIKKKLVLDEDLLAKTLLILDGFDELGDGSRKEVLEVLYESKYSSMSVVVTSRSGLFPLKNMEIRKLLPRLPHQKKTFYQKRVTILGVGKKDRQEFIKKFCPNELSEKTIDLIRKDFGKRDDFNSPLLLIMIGYFSYTKMAENERLRLTDLFKSLFNDIVKCNLTRDEILMDEEFDLFDILQENSIKYQERIEEFGEVCLKQLLKHNYSFEKSDLVTEMYSLGLLSKQTFINLFKTESQFECFHLSIMEFCVAYAIWRKFDRKVEEEACHNALFGQLSHLIETQGSTTLITIFIGNLLQDKVTHLFAKFLSFDCDLSDDDYPFWRMVAEVKGNDDIAKSIVKFIPRKSHLPDLDPSLEEFYGSKFHSDIVRHGISEKRIDRIHFEYLVPITLPEDITIPEVRIRLKSIETIKEKECINSLKRLRFLRTDCDLYYSSACDLEKYLLEFFCILGEKEISLSIHPNVCLSSLQDSIAKGILKELNFHLVLCVLKPGMVDMICSLLENNQIYELSLTNEEDALVSDLEKIMTKALLSSALTRLRIRNLTPHPVSVDFHYFGLRIWKYLALGKFDLYCSQPINDSPCQVCHYAIEEHRSRDNCFTQWNKYAINEDCKWWNDRPEMKLIFIPSLR